MTPKGGVKSVHSSYGGITVSCQWFLHGILYLDNSIYALWTFISYGNKRFLWMMCFWCFSAVFVVIVATTKVFSFDCTL